jgi:hypothetical protein
MRELERLGQEVREELGEPSPDWLRQQHRDLGAALASQGVKRPVATRWLVVAVATVLSITIWTLRSVRPLVGSAAVEISLNASSDDRRVTLEDGSSLLLSSHTRARLEEGDRVTRCTIDVGKVLFHVSAQHGREFLVKAGETELTVVGTRFSVSRDPSGVVEVLVSEGVVRVSVPNRSTPAELRAGDQLRRQGHDYSLWHAAPLAASRPGVALGDQAATTELSTPSEHAQARAETQSKGGAAVRNDWLKLYHARDYAGALAAAREVGIDSLLASLAVQPLAALADAARLGGDGELALRTFDTLGRRFPASRQAQDALFLTGRLLAERGQRSLAQRRLEAYLAQNDRGTYAIEAMGRLVEIYAATNHERAKPTARAYLERAPRGPYQRLCRSLLAAP